MIGNVDCIEMTKNFETSKWEFHFLQLCKFITLAYSNSSTFKRNDITFENIYSNTILHVAIGGHLMFFSLVFMVSNQNVSFTIIHSFGH
jgi:hypothetical protein